MKGMRKLLAGALAGAMCLGLTGCGTGGAKEADEDHTYTMWLYNAQDASYYADFAENPAMQYLTSKTWGENEDKISIEFQVPPAGSQQNNYETMIATGDYPTVLQAVVADSPVNMYEAEMIIDLTDLVKEYMPNYYEVIQTNEAARNNAVHNIDGEDKILTITTVNEGYPYYAFGMEYRRDWIVKYGRNPQTGEVFTGGYTDEKDVDSWVDDVVFPSGETDPVYISDWEWMFEIFTEAMKAEGITDGYCISMYYPGFTWSGGLVSGFGEGIPSWYKGSDGKVRFGGDTDQMRAYLECLNHWYEKGWLDQDFNERTSDIFYAIDDTNKRLGKVAMWMGAEGELGGRLDMHDGGHTEGIYVAGCALPVNDIYGPDECRNVEPWSVMAASSLAGNNYYIMDGAQDKDLGPLLSMFDYLYSDEGAVLKSLGASTDQLKEAGISTGFYEQYGLTEGPYTVNSDGTYSKVDTVKNDAGGLLQAVSLDVLPGKQLVDSIDEGYAVTFEHSKDLWIKYLNHGQIMGSAAFNSMTSEDTKTVSAVQTKLVDYMQLHAYEFIKGTSDIHNDDEWATWQTLLKKMNYEKCLGIIQPYVDANPYIG